MLARQSPAGVPSAGDYERIVVMLRRHPNHFPDLAFRQIGSRMQAEPLRVVETGEGRDRQYLWRS